MKIIFTNHLLVLHFSKSLLVILLLVTFHCSAQIRFEPGYFIDNEGERTECLVKNVDWKNNPSEFEYKLSENSNPETASLESVQEFGVTNFSKYKRFEVQIDQSSNRLDRLSDQKGPEFITKTVFLKTLIEGKASLYEYQNADIRRYFLKLTGSEILPLISKSYYSHDNIIAENVEYKRQLWAQLQCESFTMRDAQDLTYYKNDLMRYIIKYNECIASDYVNYHAKTNRSSINFGITAGLNFASTGISNEDSYVKRVDFGSKTNFHVGLEAEFVMPFNKNKWAVIMGPSYQYFNANFQMQYQMVKIDYKSIEFPIGLRHYFFLNDRHAIFLQAEYILDFPLNSVIDFEKYRDLDIKTGNNFAFGAGYNIMKKYSLALRYGTPRSLLTNYVSWRSNYNSMFVTLSYRLF